MTTGRNTAENSGKKEATGKPFQKNDPRINRKGRPKTFEELRKLAVRLAHEPLVDGKGNPVPFPGREGATSRAEAIMLQWAQSSDPRKQALFIEYAFGKVPQKTELSGADGGPVQVKRGNLTDEELREELKKRNLPEAFFEE